VPQGQGGGKARVWEASRISLAHKEERRQGEGATCSHVLVGLTGARTTAHENRMAPSCIHTLGCRAAPPPLRAVSAPRPSCPLRRASAATADSPCADAGAAAPRAWRGGAGHAPARTCGVGRSAARPQSALQSRARRGSCRSPPPCGAATPQAALHPSRFTARHARGPGPRGQPCTHTPRCLQRAVGGEAERHLCAAPAVDGEQEVTHAHLPRLARSFGSAPRLDD
jgi:hypothetical protein